MPPVLTRGRRVTNVVKEGKPPPVQPRVEMLQRKTKLTIRVQEPSTVSVLLKPSG